MTEVVKYNHMKNQQGGFLKLIIIIVVVLFLLKYFDISFSDIINWIKTLFNSIF